MVPCFKGGEAVRRDRLLHLLHAVEEVVHIDLPELHWVQGLDLVHFELPDGAIGGVPG